VLVLPFEVVDSPLPGLRPKPSQCLIFFSGAHFDLRIARINNIRVFREAFTSNLGRLLGQGVLFELMSFATTWASDYHLLICG
jgi:hypothetical protein